MDHLKSTQTKKKGWYLYQSSLGGAFRWREYRVGFTDIGIVKIGRIEERKAAQDNNYFTVLLEIRFLKMV